MQEVFLTPILREPGAAWSLRNERTGRVVADRIIGAFDSKSRRRGLLGRDRLPAGEALVIAPCWAIHTWGMRFAIDVAFVTRSGHVVAVRAAVRPWRIAAAYGAFAVVELAAGALAQSGTVAGDRVTVVAGP